MPDIARLKAEIDDDPLTRGYSGMTDAVVAVNLNDDTTAEFKRSLPKSSLTGSEVLNAINKGEFNALDVEQKAMVWNIVHLGTINPFGIEGDLFTDIFGVPSTTIAALLALRQRTVSRAVELGLGIIKVGHVQMARM